MKWRMIRAIAAKDLTEVRQNRSLWISAVAVPFLFVVVLPLFIILLPSALHVPENALFSEHGWGSIVRRMPIGLLLEMQKMNVLQNWVVWMTGYLLSPLFLLLPLMFSSVLGADSFAGEKERKTLEALLHTPASDAELFVGKVLASVTPAVAISWGSFLVYSIVVNVAAWNIMGGVWFPKPAWWPLILWVTPAVAVLGMAATVLVSARVSSTVEANQSGSSLMLLVLALVAGQLSGALFLNVTTMWWIGAVVWVVDAVLLRLAVRLFARQELVARL